MSDRRAPPGAGRTVAVGLLAVVAWLGVLIVSGRAGLDLREWTWQQTATIRFRGDVNNALRIGNGLCRDAFRRDGLDPRSAVGPPSWGAFADAYFDRYERTYQLAIARRNLPRAASRPSIDEVPDGQFDIDYPPGRLAVVALWVRHLYARPEVARRPEDGRVLYDDAHVAPMRWVNVAHEAAAALGAFALGWRVLRDAGRSRRRAGLLATLGMLLLWFNPAMILIAHGWPQWDAWVLPYVLWATWCAVSGRWMGAGALLVVGGMFKGQVLLIAPLLACWPLARGDVGGFVRFVAGATVALALCVAPWLLRTAEARWWLGGVAVTLALSILTARQRHRHPAPRPGKVAAPQTVSITPATTSVETLHPSGETNLHLIETPRTVVETNLLPVETKKQVVETEQSFFETKQNLFETKHYSVETNLHSVETKQKVTETNQHFAESILCLGEPDLFSVQPPFSSAEAPQRVAGPATNAAGGWQTLIGPRSWRTQRRLWTAAIVVAAIAWIAGPLAVVETRWLWSTGVLLALATLLLPRLWRGRRVAIAGLVMGVATLAAGVRFNGSFDWLYVGFQTDHHPQMALGHVANLPAVLRASWQWQVDSPVSLPWLAGPPAAGEPIELRPLLRGASIALLILLAARAAWGVRRRRRRDGSIRVGDANLLVVLPAAWAMLYAILPQMHERYLLWAAATSALLAMRSIGGLLAHVALTAASFAMVLTSMIASGGKPLTPEWRPWFTALMPLQPHMGYGTLTLAIVLVVWACSRERPQSSARTDPPDTPRRTPDRTADDDLTAQHDGSASTIGQDGRR